MTLIEAIEKAISFMESEGIEYDNEDGSLSAYQALEAVSIYLQNNEPRVCAVEIIPLERVNGVNP